MSAKTSSLSSGSIDSSDLSSSVSSGYSSDHSSGSMDSNGCCQPGSVTVFVEQFNSGIKDFIFFQLQADCTYLMVNQSATFFAYLKYISQGWSFEYVDGFLNQIVAELNNNDPCNPLGSYTVLTSSPATVTVSLT